MDLEDFIRRMINAELDKRLAGMAPAPAAEPSGKNMVTAQKIADMFGISESTLSNLRSQRNGPEFYKVGGRVFYKPDDVEDYIRSRRVRTAERRRPPIPAGPPPGLTDPNRR